MRNYRGKLDISADILNITKNNPQKKTQIMYKANLSYTILIKYINKLVKASLIAYEDENQYYILTEKGQKYLKIYEEYANATRFLQERQKDVCIKKKALEKLCIIKNWKTLRCIKSNIV